MRTFLGFNAFGWIFGALLLAISMTHFTTNTEGKFIENPDSPISKSRLSH